jgi:hypothetical protein
MTLTYPCHFVIELHQSSLSPPFFFIFRICLLSLIYARLLHLLIPVSSLNISILHHKDIVWYQGLGTCVWNSVENLEDNDLCQMVCPGLHRHQSRVFVNTCSFDLRYSIVHATVPASAIFQRRQRWRISAVCRIHVLALNISRT